MKLISRWQDLLERTLHRQYLERPTFAQLVKELSRLVGLMEQDGVDLEDCSLDLRPAASRRLTRWQSTLERRSFQEEV